MSTKESVVGSFLQSGLRKSCSSSRPLGIWMRLMALLVVLGAMPLFAQVDTGTIQGTVTDRTGAILPGSTVTLINEATGLVQSTRASASGLYTFTPLRIGLYSVGVAASGFENTRRDHLQLDVQQTMVVDFKLGVGTVTNSVEVTTQAPILQTQDASVGQVFESHEINSLPLNGRNFTLLAQLEAGVTTESQDNHGFALSGSFVANGTLSSFNNYLLDGIENNNTTVDFGNGNAFTVKPPPDAIDQFKVQTTNYSAQFGRAGGAVINAVLKSGQNKLYGDVWEYVRNDLFDANDYFLNLAHQKKPEYRRNQFGFTLGGPVMRNRTFFFVDYEGSRIRQGTAFTSTVPTALERSSGFSDYSDLTTYQTGTQTDNLGRVTKVGSVFDPATTRPTVAGQIDVVTGLLATKSGSVREAFANNLVPANRLSPVAVKLLNLFPVPNTGTGITNNYVSAPIRASDSDQFDVRVDHNFSAKDQTFVRFSFSRNPSSTPSPLPGLAVGAPSAQIGSQTDDVISAALGETHVFSPRMVNEFRVGYSRIHTNRLQFFANQGGLNAQYGIPGVPDAPPNGGLTQIKISGLTELGTHNNIPLNELGSETQYNDNITLDRGRHLLRFGAELEGLKTAVFSGQFPHGNFAFSGTYTNLPTGNTANTGVAQFAIEPIASSVIGGYNFIGGSNQIQATPVTQQDYRKPYAGAYAEDTWKAARNLTINAGVRYEYFQLAADHAGKGGNFLPGDATTGAQYLIDDRSKDVVLSPSFLALLAKDNITLKYTDNHQLGVLPKLNFAPRVGFAWQAAPRIVFRGGYGIFYAGIYNRGDGYNIGNAYPFAYAVNIVATSLTNGALSTDGSIGPLDKGLSNVSVVPALTSGSAIALRGIQYNSHIPYVQGINFTVQTEISPSVYYSVSYVSTLARHLESNIGSNRPNQIVPTNVPLTSTVGGVVLPPCTGATVSTTPGCSLLPFPDFPQNNIYMYLEGTSNYDALQAKIEKRFSQGSNLLANYTWSKALGDGMDSGYYTGISYRAPYVPGWGLRGEYQRQTFNVAHVFHIAGGYEIPVGVGRRYLNHRGIAEAVLGGWSMNGLITLQSGNPFTVNCSVSTNNGSGCYALTDSSKLYTGAHTSVHWANAAAFSNPVTAAGPADLSSLGAQPGQGIGPNFHRGDFGVHKQWQLPGALILEFRAEAFNVTNTPNFGQPGTLTPNSASFASITSTRDNPNDPRSFQFAGKLYFGSSR